MKDHAAILAPLLEQRILAFTPSKGQRRQLQILEAAVKCYAKSGLERITHATIAREAGVTRPLVRHYFPKQEQIFESVVRYIRARFQEMAIEAIKSEHGPEKQLRAYVASTFTWAEKFTAHAKVWQLFLYYCGVKPKFKRFHTELTEMGRERLTALLTLGNSQGVFHSSHPTVDAKLIQAIITGALTTLYTEAAVVDPKAFQERVQALCLNLAQGKSQ